MGLGIGLTFPVLSAAAVSSLPPERFGVGSAVNQTARQVGAAMGDPHGGVEGLAVFDRQWLYAALMAAALGGIATLLGGAPERRASVAPAPGLVSEP